MRRAAPRSRWARSSPLPRARHSTRIAAFDRNGERKPGSIGFAALRGGDIVGDHTVLFAGSGERIEITHRSTSRATYAEGSLRAARFVLRQKPGLFDMEQVLGLATIGR